MLWRAKKMREIEEELARCREESSAFEDVLNALDVGIALLRGGEPWFINTVGRELLGEMHPGALPTDELEVITRGTGFIVFGRKETEEEEEPNEDGRSWEAFRSGGGEFWRTERGIPHNKQWT